MAGSANFEKSGRGVEIRTPDLGVNPCSETNSLGTLAWKDWENGHRVKSALLLVDFLDLRLTRIGPIPFQRVGQCLGRRYGRIVR